MRNQHESRSDPTPAVSRRSVLAAGAGALAAGLGVGSASARTQGRFPPPNRTTWGQPIRLGDGTIAAFVTQGRSGTPQYLGLWFTADALAGLPAGDEQPSYETRIPIPPAVRETTNVEWIAADWNPHGHVPVDVYDVPHFDFHFYLMEQSAVESRIPPGECDTNGDGTPDVGVSCDVQQRGIRPLPDAQRPDGYVSTEETVPLVGDHWVDSTAPEFHGQPFTHTYIYGSFDGRLTFLEPMITTAYLRDLRGRTLVDVKTPERFPKPGLYPTQYAIRHLRAQDAYAVYLRRFRQFEGS